MRKHLVIGFIAVALSGMGAWLMAAQLAVAQVDSNRPDEDDEVVIKLPEAPEAVRNALAKVTPADKVKKVTREETENDAYVYEIDYTHEGTDCSVVFSAAGDMMELEKAVKESALPAAALAALKKEYPNDSFKDPTLVQKFYYEVHIVVNGKSRAVNVDATGAIEDEHAGSDEKDEKDAKNKGKEVQGEKTKGEEDKK